MRSVPHLQTEMLDRFKGQRDFGRIKVKISPKYIRRISQGDVGVNALRMDDSVLGVDWWMEGDMKMFNIFVGFCNNPKVDDCRAIRQALRSIDHQETRVRGVGALIALKGMVKELCEQIVSSTKVPFAIAIHSDGESQRMRVYSRLMREKWNLGGRQFGWKMFNENGVKTLYLVEKE